MLFNSFEFLLGFLPAAVLGYFLLRRIGAHEISLLWLAVTSVFFYSWWDIRNLPVLAISIAVNFGFGRLLARLSPNTVARKLGLAAGVTFNLGLLGFFKYGAFFAGQAGAPDLAASLAQVILPLGISFFTFTQIAYLADVARGYVRDYDNPVHYLLFVTYFPHLIAGPILHHGEIMPQFERAQSQGGFPSAETVGQGLTLLCLGLFKKVVIADGIAIYSTELFRAAASPGGAPTFLEAWTGALAYTFQIYFDFSGYSDMAVGASLLLGIALPFNFDSPYKATSIIDFWRRWHMTLSRFLRDYLYFPLGGNRLGRMRQNANLLTVMVLGGLWHGAGWTFVAWGTLHGLFLLVNHSWRRLVGQAAWTRTSHYQAAAWLLTFLAVVVAWVFFRAESMSSALAILSGMIGLNGFALGVKHMVFLGPLADSLSHLGVRFLPETTLSLLAFPWIAGCLLVSVLLPNSQEWTLGLRTFRLLPTWKGQQYVALALGVAAALVVGMLSGPSEFLYFNF